MLLENWINKIKVKGFHNNMNRILYKQSTITRLEDSIKFLEESLNKIRRTNSQVFVSKGKAQNENDKVKEKYEKVDREKGKYVDDIIRIKKEISTIPLETEFLAIILERKVTYATLYKLFHEMHGSPLAPKEWYEDLKQQIMILK